ncbi:PREDICTED: uncharacterized protein LOC100631796 [Amphimedon queenslandica]|uniref:Dynein axonemal assembly factor 5 TPR repeats domain-containing protein n=2 Tax=Amphimedon queenslandica TaxID=400682 RepID=A0A1X7TZI0_AMPQE|nr:PREDICTED: uncharacterized protein LOC100631796 [Amphimedon queenslandica]|eukprot:XP_019856793.1 PREDICTED: uncharacterized protein LOC100631796 [Amphimedon queenslandica]
MATDSTSSISLVLSLLKCKTRLEREKGLSELKKLIETNQALPEDLKDLQSSLSVILSSSDESNTWEEKHGALLATNLLIDKKKASEEFKDNLKGLVSHLLEHNESRIRLLTGEIIGGLCKWDGVTVYEELRDVLLSGIKNNIVRELDPTDHAELVKKLQEDNTSEDQEENRSASPSPPPTASNVFHETAGWKSLETYMNALQYAVEGCGSSFEPHITSELLDLLFTALEHINRFVRETGYKVLAAIVKCPDVSDGTKDKYSGLIAEQLVKGLSDNWSQVRMSASIATRDFLITSSNTSHLPLLIPPMCLNRYYIAEGVRLYSQETWRQVTMGKGTQLVENYIDKVVSFYIKESEASNHAVREAACTCIAELGNKISPDAVRPHVSQLVTALLDCFHDESWPVRDAACLACGNFIACFPDECHEYLSQLYPLFLANLEDSIPSVRQGAAVAIGNLVKTYGTEVEDKVISVIKEWLPLVSEQPPSVDSSDPLHPGLESGPAVFGVVKRIHDNDMDTHSNQQMYSCGSLAPKMKRRGGGGGCMHSDFHKPAQPWEKSEGCIHLLSELSKVDRSRSNVALLLPLLAETTGHRQYIQHCNHMETLMKQLPVIAKSLGKRVFKQHIELFFDGIFYGIISSSPQLKMASSDCVQSLTALIGPMIMRGRIEQYNPSYLSLLDRTDPIQ